MRLSDRFPGLMLWHTVAAVAAVFAAKALLYWAADWLGLGPLYSALAGPSWGSRDFPSKNDKVLWRPRRPRPPEGYYFFGASHSQSQ